LSTDPGEADLPPYFLTDSYPVQTLPGFADLAGYFNIDNGSGKIRGIYTEGNFAVVPIFHEWLSPFASLGASTVVAEPTGGTDHVFLSRLGLPAFQFIQDPLDYETRVHRPGHLRSFASGRLAPSGGGAGDGSCGCRQHR
jgi:carboxypeptidase Q